jgi:DNA-binding XRE family transcriptional regulator
MSHLSTKEAHELAIRVRSKALGDEFIRLRAERNYQVSWLSKHSGISQQTIRLIESGHARQPKPETICAIVRVLHNAKTMSSKDLCTLSDMLKMPVYDFAFGDVTDNPRTNGQRAYDRRSAVGDANEQAAIEQRKRA